MEAYGDKSQPQIFSFTSLGKPTLHFLDTPPPPKSTSYAVRKPVAEQILSSTQVDPNYPLIWLNAGPGPSLSQIQLNLKPPKALNFIH